MCVPRTKRDAVINSLFEDHVTVVALVDGLGKDSHEGNHCQSSVVDFGDKSFGLGFLSSVLAESERIEKVERNRVGNGGSELRVFSWLSSLHVVGNLDIRVSDTGGKFAVDLQESNNGKDLVLGFDREGGPLLWGRQVGAWEWSSIKLHRPREVEVGLNTVTNEGGHSNTSVPSFWCITKYNWKKQTKPRQTQYI